MNKKKIFNDPVYGFITIPHEFIFELIEHRYFQRLRRIKQLGMSDLVYPGATHTRFHHTLGALHLMTLAIETLRAKNIEISEEEEIGAYVAITLHDIGHGPFSHALEHRIINVHHEDLSMLFMEALNKEFGGKLSLGIAIFCDKYPKHFLHQLVSGQLDMDRMDYLNRDSFFTGVSEGVIGYDRIIKMLNVVDNELVIEEKGIYSIEKFLIARRLMYWQVYLHKTVVSAEQMVIKLMERLKKLTEKNGKILLSETFDVFLHQNFEIRDFQNENFALLDNFANLDDYELFSLIKKISKHQDKILAYLASSILDRKLLKVEMHKIPPSQQIIDKYQKVAKDKLGLDSLEDASYLIFFGTESNIAYTKQKEEIKVLLKTGEVKPFSSLSEYYISTENVTKYYFCYPSWVKS